MKSRLALASVITGSFFFSATALAAAPSAPADLLATPDLRDRSVSFEWSANSAEEEVQGYRFYIGFDANSWATEGGQDLGMSTTLINRDLDPTATYYYGFSAYNTDGESPLSRISVNLGQELGFVAPSPDGGVFTDATVVSFDIPDTTLITYTLDGSDPSDPDNIAALTIYASPFTINKTATLRYFVTDTETDYIQDVRDVSFVIDSTPLAEEADRLLFEGMESGVAIEDVSLEDSGLAGDTGAAISSMELINPRLTAGRDNTVSTRIIDANGAAISDGIAVTLNLLKAGDRTTTTFGGASKNGVASFMIPADQIVANATYELWTFSNTVESPHILLSAHESGQLDETGTGLNVLLFLAFVIGLVIIRGATKSAPGEQ